MERRYAIGNFICELRQERGLTQKELGELLGVTNKAVSKWENGAALPRLDTIRQLSAILGCTQEELFLGHRIPKEGEEHKKPAEESYISVVQRCDECRHEPEVTIKGLLSYKLLSYNNQGLRCKKCGATVRLTLAWAAVILVVYILFLSLIITAAYLIPSALEADRLVASGFPTAEDAAFHRQLNEHFPNLGSLVKFVYIAAGLLSAIVGFSLFLIVVALIMKKAKYRIMGYPHSEDGKIVF